MLCTHYGKFLATSLVHNNTLHNFHHKVLIHNKYQAEQKADYIQQISGTFQVEMFTVNQIFSVNWFKN